MSQETLNSGKIVLDRVTKRFPDAPVPVISEISLNCEPGEFVVVVGPSGSGKSTLLSMIAGMTVPDEGEIRVSDRVVRNPGPDRAVVFQDHGLFPWLNAEENIEFGLKMQGISRQERMEKVHEALKMVHLSQSGKKLVHQLSGGMRQRVAIARALVMNPAVLLMDEPFAALDAQTRSLIHIELQELWLKTRKTVLFVTHSVGEAVRLGTRIIVLKSNPGKIRREIQVNLPYPRPLDGAQLNEFIHLVRTEIEDEVNENSEKLYA